MAADLIIELRDVNAGRVPLGQPGYTPPPPRPYAMTMTGQQPPQTAYTPPPVPAAPTTAPTTQPPSFMLDAFKTQTTTGKQPSVFQQAMQPPVVPAQSQPSSSPVLGPAFQPPPPPSIPPVPVPRSAPDVPLQMADPNRGTTASQDAAAFGRAMSRQGAKENALEKERDAKMKENQASRDKWYRETSSTVAATAQSAAVNASRFGSGDISLIGDVIQSSLKKGLTFAGTSVGGAVGGPAGAAIGGAAAVGVDALVTAMRGLTDGLTTTADRLAMYNGALAQAKAEADVAQILGDIRRANLVGNDLAKLTESHTRLTQTAQDALLLAIKPLIPVVIKALDKTSEGVGYMVQLFAQYNPYILSLLIGGSTDKGSDATTNPIDILDRFFAPGVARPGNRFAPPENEPRRPLGI